MPAARAFTAETSTTGTRYWWWVRVYDTPAQLQAAAHRHHPQDGRRSWDGCLGCHQPVPFRQRLDGSGVWATLAPPNNLLGVIRLSRPITIEHVAHEATHAALYAYRVARATASPSPRAAFVNLGDQCGPHEERLAYLVGELTDSILGQL